MVSKRCTNIMAMVWISKSKMKKMKKITLPFEGKFFCQREEQIRGIIELVCGACLRCIGL